MSARQLSYSNMLTKRLACLSLPLVPISRRRKSWLIISKLIFKFGTLQDKRSSSLSDMHSTEVQIAVLLFLISQTRRASILWHAGRKASCRMLALTILRPIHSLLLETSLIRKQIVKFKLLLWNNGAARTETFLTTRLQPLKTSQLTMPSLKWQS